MKNRVIPLEVKKNSKININGKRRKMKEDELKRKAEENYGKHSKKFGTLWNGAIYSEGALFLYRYAIKELREEIRTDNTDVIVNACKKITELAEENELLKTKLDALSDGMERNSCKE